MYKIKYTQENKKRIISVIILSLIIFLGYVKILFAKFDDPNMQEQYSSILEKTNQQLSLFWNPYNTILTILTALFTIFTIIFGLIIYFQSKEYRKKIAQDKKDYKQKIDEFLEQQQQYAKKLIDERNIKFKQIETNLNNTISEYEKKLKTLLETPKEQKYKIEEIEKSIEKLKTEKELLKSQIEPISVMPDYNYPGILTLGKINFHKCSHCGFGFKVRDYSPNTMTTIPILGATTITCPKCGNVDQI